ncbi:unnamed protein product, partial [Oppiella nova]
YLKLCFRYIIILFIICILNEVNSEIQNDGTTKAHLVPYPQQIVTYPTQLTIDSKNFKFVTKTKQKCDLLDEAIKRYQKLSFINGCYHLNHLSENTFKTDYFEPNEDYLTNITIEVKGDCIDEWPHLHMDEMYTLRIDTEDFPKQAVIFANTIWGALRALETFSQLTHHKSDTIYAINSTLILDKGAKCIYEYRMIFYLQEVTVYLDDQSFPYVSEKFPELSEKGSYNPKTHVYNTQDIENVITFARMRGIRVIVELDSPSHSLSWGKGYPKLLTECYSGGQPTGQMGALDPSRNSTFEFLNSLFTEIAHKFPDQYIHIGGDEVNTTCWKTNPDIHSLIVYYKGLNYSQPNIPSFTNCRLLSVINVWKENYNKELYNLTKLNYPVILSSCWYLNKISYGYDWFQYYGCDPQNFNGTEQQNKLVLGGQVSMWGEWVDASNFMTRTWFATGSICGREAVECKEFVECNGSSVSATGSICGREAVECKEFVECNGSSVSVCAQQMPDVGQGAKTSTRG